MRKKLKREIFISEIIYSGVNRILENGNNNRNVDMFNTSKNKIKIPEIYDYYYFTIELSNNSVHVNQSWVEHL